MSTVHWLGVVTLMSLVFSGPLRGQFDAILFNGLNGYYSLPHEAALNGAAGHTIEVDVQPNCVFFPQFGLINTFDPRRSVILAKGNTPESGYEVSLVNDRFRYTVGGNTPTTYTTDFGTFSPEQRLRVTIVHSLTRVQIYVNGRLVSATASSPTVRPAPINTGSLTLGARRGNSGIQDVFTGLFFGMRYWNTALTQEGVRRFARDGPEATDPVPFLDYNIEREAGLVDRSIINRGNGEDRFNASPQGSTAASPRFTTRAAYNAEGVDLGPDASFCKGFGYPLSIPDREYLDVQWSTDNVTTSIVAQGDAIYWVLAETDRCRWVWDSVDLTRIEVREVFQNRSLCPGDSAEFEGIKYGPGDTLTQFIAGSTVCDSLITTIFRSRAGSTRRELIELCSEEPQLVEGRLLFPNDSFEIREDNGILCDRVTWYVGVYTPVLLEPVELEACGPSGNQTATFRGQEFNIGLNQSFTIRNPNGCDSLIPLNILATAGGGFLGPDTASCGRALTYRAANPDIRWKDGPIGDRTFSQSGEYIAQLISRTGCEVSDTIKITIPERQAYLPTAFSPNLDGVNDCYQPFFAVEELTDYQLIIYDRWGAKVFESEDPAACWDGTLGDQEMPTGIYAFQLAYSHSATTCPEPEVVTGTISLLR